MAKIDSIRAASARYTARSSSTLATVSLLNDAPICTIARERPARVMMASRARKRTLPLRCEFGAFIQI
jgi:hypothetical protein